MVLNCGHTVMLQTFISWQNAETCCRHAQNNSCDAVAKTSKSFIFRPQLQASIENHAQETIYY
jgi:hypothetical protein